jgi:cysteine synthase A
MRAAGQAGSVATLICDGGERYLDTYYDDAWIASQGLDLTPYLVSLQEFTRD